MEGVTVTFTTDKCPHGHALASAGARPWSNLEVGIECWWCLGRELSAIKRGLGPGFVPVRLTNEP